MFLFFCVYCKSDYATGWSREGQLRCLILDKVTTKHRPFERLNDMGVVLHNRVCVLHRGFTGYTGESWSLSQRGFESDHNKQETCRFSDVMRQQDEDWIAG